MKKKLINNVLKEALANGGPTDGVWPNVDPKGKTVRPYFEVQFTTSVRNGPVLKGDLVREVGQMVVTVVVKEGSNEDAANDYADDISDLFPQGSVFPIDGGFVTITNPADIRAGVRDSPDWRVPVVVKYTAVNT